MPLYIQNLNKHSAHAHKIADGIHVSTLSSMTLSEYVTVRREHCSLTHTQPCIDCCHMLQVAKLILDHSLCRLHQAFSIVSPTAKYSAARATTKLLQMPLVSIRIGNASSGLSFTILLEKFLGTDYVNMASLLNQMTQFSTKGTKDGPNMDQPFVKMLLNLAQSPRERECLRVAIVKASGISATKARQYYGFENMAKRAAAVEESIMEAQKIRDAVQDLAQTQDKALLDAYGIVDIVDSTDSCESETDSELEPQQQKTIEISADIMSTLVSMLTQSGFNWFEFQEKCIGVLEERNKEILSEFYSRISQCGFEEHELDLIKQSHNAYLAAQTEESRQQQIVNAINGDVVTDSESDDPNNYIGLDPKSEMGIMIIAKKRAAIKRRARRLRAKLIAEKRYLSNKTPKRVSKILEECPNIGKTIENFVSERNVGADAWRRTGLLTFDGNVHLKEKVTYERIRLHLTEVYQRHFSFGTVVQLCVARNKRRRSSSRYHGVAQVTTRRARKGFNLRYNPDTHWSSSFYKGLNKLQYTDGSQAVIINRDDACGFRLDTLTTCKQHATPVVTGQETLTTRTDYVNKYSSIIQTTSYNFTGTGTTVERCAGVVKAAPLHHKNPAQHAADLVMLQGKDELLPVFFNGSNPKPIDFIRVDGAMDEGPSHDEVQFWWTVRHVEQKKIATLVTTRSSGSSFLNRVELQNGCLAHGHSNTFIPSTLAGSCMDPTTGKVNDEKHKQNLSLAVDAYIHRVDNCPCGETTIHLYKGPPSDSFQLKRAKLPAFLKSKKSKEKLKLEDPELYDYFQNIWTVRKNHMVTDIPSYIFMLLCCFKPGCTHPRCQEGKQPTTPDTWYPGGPPLTHLPLPKPDPNRPWGGTCSTCKETCSGHYCEPSFTDVTDKVALKQVSYPPSVYLKELFTEQQGKSITEDILNAAGKKVLLPAKEVGFWLEHLNTVSENRRRGAAKAAETRRRKQASSDRYFCGTCDTEYKADMPDIDFWICCDFCTKWYCCQCELLDTPPTTEQYKCLKCQYK